MFKNMNKTERAWVLYDVGNSVFTLMVSTLIPIWFDALAEDAGIGSTQYLAMWSYAVSIVTIITAILGPILGSISDNKGARKPMFSSMLYTGVAGCILMGLVPSWQLYIAIFIIAKCCYQLSLVLYDSMLIDVAAPERMDALSSGGYAYGYLGSCIPFIGALAMYLLGTMGKIPMKLAIFFAFLIAGVWWLAVTIPLLKNYRQTHFVEHQKSAALKESFSRLGRTLSRMYRDEKHIFCFLLAFFLYIDGVYTSIDEAVAIGTSLGLDTTGLLVVLLLTQVVAFAFATLFGKLSEKYNTISLISVCIFGYFGVAILALFMHTLWQFGIMAFVVGMFQGAIQALSRSYYASIIPAESSGEYFGIYDICGKGASFVGTMLIAITVSITGSINISVAALGILFVIGFLLLRRSAVHAKNRKQ